MTTSNVELFVRAVLEGPPDQILARVGDTQVEIARALGVAQPTVSGWISAGIVPQVVRYLILAREGVVRSPAGRWMRLGRKYGRKHTGYAYFAAIERGEIKPTPGGGRKPRKGTPA